MPSKDRRVKPSGLALQPAMFLRLSVIDLKAAPPAVIATLETGKGPAGISISRQRNLALVANRSEGTVSMFGITGKEVIGLGAVKLGDEKTGGQPRGDRS